MTDQIVAVHSKTCSKCGECKPATLEFFHPNKGGKYGLRGQCRPCRLAVIRDQIKEPDIAARRKAYSAEYISSGRNAARNREWNKGNPEKARIIAATWRSRNKDKVREAQQKYREANRDKVRAKQRRADAKAQKNPVHVLNKRIKSRIREMLRGSFVPRSIGLHLEFTKAELVHHIGKQFTKGMTWERLTAGEIHVDHIIPVASFDIKELGDNEFKACWALSNLRPLWNTDNWSKQAKVLTLL